MFGVSVSVVIFLTFIQWSVCLLPAKFQWKTIDFAWEGDSKPKAIADGSFVPENVMPTGIALWRDKIFITIPRWKKGVPASLNYIMANGTQQQPLQPYPSWHDAFVSDRTCCVSTNSSVVSAFRVTVDACDRLWTVDNGVTDMSISLRNLLITSKGDVKQISEPAIFIFDLRNDTLIQKYVLSDDILKDSSVLTSIVVDDSGGCNNTFAYITDMGANAIIVFDLQGQTAWRVDHPFFHFDPGASVYRVGGVDFFWSDGVSAAALSKKNSDGSHDLFLHPTSSTKLFKISTKVLKNRNASDAETNAAVQLSKNGIGCWNLKMPCNEETAPLVISDCNLLEFPSDIKVDDSGNLWVLSNRQSRFLYDTLDYNQMNFRILTAPVASVIEDSACVKHSWLHRSKRESSAASGSAAPAPASAPASASASAPAKRPSKLKNFFGSRKNSKK